MDCCDHGYEPAGSIKRRKISGVDERLLASQEELCTVELVRSASALKSDSSVVLQSLHITYN
jgi:hypothetical protein